MKQSHFINSLLQQATSEKKTIKKIIKVLKGKTKNDLDTAFSIEHQNVFENSIDCLECANCCKSLGPRLTDKDIGRLSKYLGMKPSEYTSTYLKVDEDGDYVLREMPCPFLNDDHYCQVYEVRPKACREYPHTNRKKMHQILDITEKNARQCPAVYLILKSLAQELKLNIK
jgi:uncharacterized protein